MRPRIKIKVDVQNVISDLDRRREVYSIFIVDIMKEHNLSFREAKNRLNQDVKFKCMKRELSLIN